MDKWIRIVTYSTIGFVYGLFALAVAVGLFFVSLTYGLGFIGYVVVVIVAGRFLPDVWVYIIAAIPIIVVLHILVYSWLFTVIISVLAAFIIFADVKLESKPLEIIGIVAISGVCMYALEFDGFHEVPDITDGDIDHVTKKMNAHDGVEDTYIDVKEYKDEDTISCRLDVDGSMSRENWKEAGEACFAAMAESVFDGTDYRKPDELYNDYALRVTVREGSDWPVYEGSRGIHNDEITWHLHEEAF